MFFPVETGGKFGVHFAVKNYGSGTTDTSGIFPVAKSAINLILGLLDRGYGRSARG